MHEYPLVDRVPNSESSANSNTFWCSTMTPLGCPVEPEV